MKHVILHTKPGDANFHLFESLPYEIYTVDNLRSRLPENFNSEYLESCYVLCVDGKPKARAVLYMNPHLRYEGKKSFCVGNYESVEDAFVSDALLNYISSRAKQLGA